MYKLPKIIGHPGYQNSPDGMSNSDYGDSLPDTLDQSLQMVTMRPMDTQISKSINIYRGKPAWDEFVGYLKKNQIDPGDNKNYLTVVCNTITPLSETYANEYGQSELFGALQNIASGGLQEAAFMTGYKGKDTLQQLSNDKDGVIGQAAGAALSGLQGAESLMQSLGMSAETASNVTDILANPTQKIDIPQMWKGNSFNAQYEISIRLYCFSPLDDEQYFTNILAPLGALLQFVCPRSKNGKFYQWPFLMEFELPGLVHLPLAYASNCSVIKGGDVNDLTWKYRPGIVDLRMTINTVWGVAINSYDPDSDDGSRPTIFRELEQMSKKRGDMTSTAASITANNQEVIQESDGLVTEFEKRYEQSGEDTDALNAIADMS